YGPQTPPPRDCTRRSASAQALKRPTLRTSWSWLTGGPHMTDLTYRSPRTEVRDSAIHGRGLFAQTDIARGEIVAVRGGHVLTRRQWEALAPGLGSAEIQLTEDLFIAPVDQAERHGSMLYVNHCCDPNVAIQGQTVLVAMRDIRAGEELTIDWATTDDLDD